MRKIILTLTLLLNCAFIAVGQTSPKMMFADNRRNGNNFSKDPHVVDFGGRYLMYYSTPPSNDPKYPHKGWGIGIAESRDLINWTPVGVITPAAEYEANGLCAPGAMVSDGKVHLFYQTYGNGPKDAICHAVSTDGINFERNPTNPIFKPTGSWNNGRAIDAEVFFFKNKYFLYFATRDPKGEVQMQGVATAPKGTNFNREEWTQSVDYSILKPELDWEKKCIEGASIIERYGKLWMFYAGAYNNEPQQIGVAVSSDGINWTRHMNVPFLANGKDGQWNSSESGHPHIFDDKRNKRSYLFFQGNNDRGRTWYISNIEVKWSRKGPEIIK